MNFEPEIKYDDDLKKRMDSNKIYIDEMLDLVVNDKSTYMVKYKPLSKKVKLLPKEIQRRIYVFAMKNYWKDNLLRKPILPLHIIYNNYLIQEKKKVLIDNIHFLHLDHNTLPENKKYIMGCQCSFCVDIPREKKNKTLSQVEDEDDFLKSIHGNEGHFGNGLISPNMFVEYEYQSYVSGYDYKRDSFYNPIYDNPNESPIYFSSDITDKFKI
tara:strand:+ start:3795 stop:4433 length:639 start_codon:yes stop_codon:yes gene_type:complete